MSKRSVRLSFAWSPLINSVSPRLRGVLRIDDKALYTIPISPEMSDANDCLLQSFAATPGRYLEALYERINEITQDEDRVVILSPSTLPDESTLSLRLLAIERAIKGKANKKARDFQIWTAAGSDRPLAYDISLETFKTTSDARLALRHLSTTDARLDSKIFSSLCKVPVSLNSLAIDANDKVESTPGFLDSGTEDIHLKQAIHLVASLVRRGPEKALGDPLFVMPYEAGDLLFFSLALKERGFLRPSILTLDRFAPIVKKVLPEARLFRMASRVPEDHRKRMPEHDFLKQHILPYIPLDRSFVILRPTRSVWSTRAHLLDQFRFALGYDFKNESNKAVLESLRLTSAVRRVPSASPRVLCHFNGGWKLKHYPLKWQAQLLGLLKKEGFKVTLLSETTLPGVRSYPFKSLDELDELLSENDFMIGVDSFPAHYASLAAGLPTLTLFGSTRVTCAHLPEQNSAVALERGIDCNPCGQVTECPRYFTSVCLNYPEPEAIIEELKKLAARTQ